MFIVHVNEGFIPLVRAESNKEKAKEKAKEKTKAEKKEKEKAEELRLFYVAATRAEKQRKSSFISAM